MPESLRILILEDRPADAELIQFELQEAGLTFTAKVVMTESDFLRELQEFQANLILSDYDLPQYNGALALAEARRRCPDTPFILVTGAVGEDRAIEILTQGAKDYVLKTRLQQRLVPAVRRALAEAQEQRARNQAEAELRKARRTLEERVNIRTVELQAEIVARKKVEEEILQNESRLRRLVDILQHPSETIQGFLDYALDQAIQLTKSKIGYIYHYHEDRKEFVLNTWSKEVMAACAVANPQTCYKLDKTGIWGEAVRQRRPIIVNDFQAAHPMKKGYPEGHVQLVKFITVPIFKSDSIVGVVGLANKETNYEETDILQASLLMEAAWKVTEHKQAEEKIQASLMEKETMLKEIHHRVKNNLQVISSLLNMQASYLQDEKAREALQESMARVRTMAMIHTQLYQSTDLTKVAFDLFIRDLIGNISQSYGRTMSPVEICVDADEIHLGMDASIPCGLILNELVSNALKHAFPEGKEGEINIRMQLEESRVMLTVQDNGIGCPESIDLTNLKSLGLELVNILAGQINGKIDMQVDGGTTWTISFPLKNDREWRNG